MHAVDGVSFAIGGGERSAWSASPAAARSTVGRTVLRLMEPTSGADHLDGTTSPRLGKAEMRPHRRSMQIVFQDPFASLNPRMTAGDIVGEPLQRARPRQPAGAQQERVAELFAQVGLRADADGATIRISSPAASASASASRARWRSAPSLIVCDEPVSALDVSIQAQIINLLMDLQREFGFSYLFIAHDLAVVAHISHRVAVMYLGRIVEIADKSELFANPRHPYTQALLASVPVADPAKQTLKPMV